MDDLSNKGRTAFHRFGKNMKWIFLPSSQFASYADRWQQLNAENSNSPLLMPEFVQPLLTEFGTGKELLAYCELEGVMQAMTIVSPRGYGLWETFQPSQAPIGPWLHRAELDLPTLLTELMEQLPGFPLSFGLTHLDPELVPRPADTGRLRTLNYIDTARIDVTGSFDDYWNTRGKNLRSNLKKQRAKLQKDGVTNRMQVSRASEEVADAIANYGKLESAGWKAQGGTAIHPDNAQGRFYRSMLEAFCRRDAGRIYRYWFDDRLVAMDLCIEGADSIIVLKTTYDESIPNSLSPTLLMREEACRQLFDERRFSKIEFYGKVMEWHRRWTDEVRTMYHATGYRWAVLLELRIILGNSTNKFNQLRTQLQSAPDGKPSTE
jgi:CelD/BcsL family acetyltransferase involved in cellulose biosynthesis